MTKDHDGVLATFSELINPMKVRTLRTAGLDVVEDARDGVYVTDLRGRRFIDCFTGAGSFNVGRRNPAIVAALEKAIHDEGADLGNFPLMSAAKADLARKLSEITPGDLDCVMYGSGGGEANDFAIKLARGYTLRSRIVTTTRAYHGHTGFALSAIGRDAYQTPFEPLMPGFTRIDFGDLKQAETAIDETTAAIIVEPVQGEGGINISPPGYLAGLRRICDERGALLILDEIQTGMGRTGTMFACQQFGVVPDIMTLGKSLGGGLYPISATMFRRPLLDFVYANPFIHLSTFGGADLGCRVALAAIDYIIDNDLPAHAAEMGARFEIGFEKLRARYPQLLTEIRRLGLMIGLQFTDESLGPRMSKQLSENGVIAVYTGNQPSVMRLMPPLIIEPEEVDAVLGAFDRAMSAIEAGPTDDNDVQPQRARRRPVRA